MKKVFVLFAVAAMIVACNKPAEKSQEAVDSVATEIVEEIDSLALEVDSTLNAAADSVAAAVN
ncbi:MAG: hypothetical protein GX102_05210 [Porphyromonadaceae bacterium]|nr:hypothetical protein [Porphyromonadaceae bacterium]